jgi:redox-sensitive bicupin YhaK (pirin superfamily)
VPVASGRGHDGAVSIHQRDAVLWAARLDGGDRVQLPEAPHVHLYVARGSVRLEGAGELATGDAARLTAAGALEVVAGTAGAEILVWETS